MFSAGPSGKFCQTRLHSKIRSVVFQEGNKVLDSDVSLCYEGNKVGAYVFRLSRENFVLCDIVGKLSINSKCGGMERKPLVPVRLKSEAGPKLLLLG